MSEKIIKKKDKVQWSNNYGTYTGIVKYVCPNPYGSPQVIIETGYKQTCTQPIENLEVISN